jgi:hypothetical protein
VDAQIHGAIVGGVLGGVVVFSALAFERRLGRRDDEQARTVQAAADAVRSYAAAVSRNVRAEKGSEAHLASGAEITGAVAQLIVLGPPGIAQRLLAFDQLGWTLATAEGQQEFLNILDAVRTSVLPHQDSLDQNTAAQVLFERNLVEPPREAPPPDQ